MDTNQPGRALVAATPDDDLIKVLGSSLYPGARPESIRLVLAWCKATGRDPMKKPIHIVPMEVKDAATGQKAWRDVLMPGIGTYRTDAATSGAYAGIDEPEFGPPITERFENDVVTFPEWCRVVVYKIVAGERRAFAAKEYWVENYASGYQGKGVNSMWKKRRYAQLAKCTEAQALRKAFPDECGQTNTTDEMEGKSFSGETIDGVVDDQKPQRETRREQHRPIKSEVYEGQTPPPGDAERISAFLVQTDTALRSAKNGTEAHKILVRAYESAPTMDDLAGLEAHPFRRVVRETFPTFLRESVDQASATAASRIGPGDKEWKDPTWDAPTGVGSDLAGVGHNANQGEGTVVDEAAAREEVEMLARHLAAEDRRDADGEQREWLPGDP